MRYSSAATLLMLALGAVALVVPGHVPGQSLAPVADGPATASGPFTPSAAKKDPELDKLVTAEAEAARDVAKLVAEYRQSEDDAERTKIKARLSAALTKQFE